MYRTQLHKQCYNQAQSMHRRFVSIPGGAGRRSRSTPINQSINQSIKQSSSAKSSSRQAVAQPEASPLELFQSALGASERSLYDSLFEQSSNQSNQSIQAFSPSHRIHNVSELFLPITREIPTASHAKSHHLMLMGGFVRSTTSGIYSFLPLGLRVLNKLIRVIDLEMANIGAQKLDLPLLLNANLWHKTGRWESTGSELFRLKDRKGVDFCLGPTHEEAITDLVSHDIHTFRQLPAKLYQIGKKFRDEARPRAGILRAREFLMKDLYTFDVSEERALESYDAVVAAYKRIFERLGVRYIQAEADTGNIGGDNSHEFHIPSEAGEDQILKCSKCSYAANLEKAVGDMPLESAAQPTTKSSKSLKSSFPAVVNTNLTDDNLITRFVRSLMPKQGLRSVPLKYEVLVNPENKSSVYLVLLDAKRDINPLFVKSHLGCSTLHKVSATEGLRLVGECMKHQSSKTPSVKAEMLVDSSCVEYGVDIDVEAMSALFENVEMGESALAVAESKRKMAADEEAALAEFEASLPTADLLRPDGEVDLAKLMTHIEGVMQSSKGKSLMDKFSANKDAAGNVRFGAKASIESQLPSIDQVKAKVDPKPVSDPSVQASIIDAPRQGVFRSAASGDRCTCRGCTGTLTSTKGIEVGHVFYLGTKYSKPLNAEFKSSHGEQKTMEMGCYGLGVSRLLASIAEVQNDERGVQWPSTISPYTAVVVPVDEQCLETATQIYQSINQSNEFYNDVLFDDRVGEDGLRLGARIRHLQMIGIPHFILVGKKSLSIQSTNQSIDQSINQSIDQSINQSSNQSINQSIDQPTVEIETRRDGSKVTVPISDMLSTLIRLKGEEIKEGIKRARS